MNSAEFKTTRQILGISALEFATYLQIDYRAVQRMENAKTDPKPFALESLNRLYSFYKSEVKKSYDLVDELLFKKVESITLIRYKKEDFRLFNPDYPMIPEQINSTVLARIKEYVELKGAEVKIVYFDPIEYKKWLSNRKDSRELRALWGSTLKDKLLHKEVAND